MGLSAAELCSVCSACAAEKKEEGEGWERKKKKKEKKEKGEKEKEKKRVALAGFAAAVGHARAAVFGRSAMRTRNEEKKEMGQ